MDASQDKGNANAQLQPNAKWEWKVTNSQTVKRGLPKIQMQINIIRCKLTLNNTNKLKQSNKSDKNKSKKNINSAQW